MWRSLTEVNVRLGVGCLLILQLGLESPEELEDSMRRMRFTDKWESFGVGMELYGM